METIERKSHFDTLESVLDQSSMPEILNMLARICNEKAEHLASNWQDEHAAKCWERAASRIASCAETDAVRRLRF